MAAVWATGCSESAETVVPPVEATEPITLAQVQPPEGGSGGGRFATIVGTGFDRHRAVEVSFGDTPSPRTAVITADRVQVEVPPGAEGPVTVTVRQGDRSASLPDGFRYTAAE